MHENGRQTLFRQTLFRRTLFRQSAVRTTQYISSTLGICRNSRNWKEIGMGHWVEALDASKARHWSRHWGDWGEQSLGIPQIPVGLGCPSSRKVTTYFHTIVLPLIFGIWFSVFPISTACWPIQLQSATRCPDCAWTVGIALMPWQLNVDIYLFHCYSIAWDR